MNLLDLMVTVGVDDKATPKLGPLSDGLKTNLSTAAKVGAAALAAVTAAAVAMGKAIADSVHEVTEYGDNIDKMSQKLGLSTDAYQKWAYVLSQAGTDIDSMQTGLKTLTNQIDDAKNGSADAQARFAMLGISMEDLGRMSREEIFEATIHGFQGMADSTERAALANDLFGRSGQNLTPLFNQSAEDTQALMDKAERLGMVMSKDAVKGAVDLHDAMDTLHRTMDGVRNAAVAEFLPGLALVADGISEMIGGDVEKGTEMLEEGLDQIVAKIEEVGPRIVEIVGRVATVVAPHLVEALGLIIAAMATEIIKHIPDIMQLGLEMVLALLQGLVSGIAPAIEQVNQFLQGILDAIGGFFGSLVDAGAQLVQSIMDGAAETGKSMADFFGGFIEDGLKAVLGFVGKMLDAGRNLWDNLKKGATTVGKTIADTFRSWIQNGLGNVLGFVGSMWNAGTSLITNLLNGAAQIGWNIANSFWDWLNNAYQQVLNFGSAFYNAGVSILNGLISGIWAGFSNAASAVSQGLSWIRSYLPFSPAKRGPFSGRGWTLYSGEALMEGFAEGIEKAAGVATRAMDEAASDVYGALDGEYSVGITAKAGTAQGGVMAELQALREDVRNMKLVLAIDGRAFAQATVGEMDAALNTRIARTVYA